MNKAKISIALTKSLLKQINDECKQTGLSRSSFIEMILRQHYGVKVEKEQLVLRTTF
jgi:metal-responsive CopG/Arc/MetJ family transcriptional regulator